MSTNQVQLALPQLIHDSAMNKSRNRPPLAQDLVGATCPALYTATPVKGTRCPTPLGPGLPTAKVTRSHAGPPNQLDLQDHKPTCQRHQPETLHAMQIKAIQAREDGIWPRVGGLQKSVALPWTRWPDQHSPTTNLHGKPLRYSATTNKSTNPYVSPQTS